MSEIRIGNLHAVTSVVGDGNNVTAHGGPPPELDELAAEVQAGAASIRDIEATLEELRAELAKQPVRKERVRALLATLTTGAGTLTAMVDGVEKVRQALGLQA
ncbi:hypothetical protein ACWKSP_13800 [Micromonosporaceae bacterium Da 78-11]